VTSPIDIIANAIRESRPMAYPSPPKDIAEVAVNALTDERIVRRTYQILAIRGTYDVSGPGGLEGLVREVLRLVGEA
jgi:hypothetical protein